MLVSCTRDVDSRKPAAMAQADPTPQVGLSSLKRVGARGASAAQDDAGQERLTEDDRRRLSMTQNAYFGAAIVGQSSFPEVPTASDWAAAARMSDEELQAEAKRGDTKAKFLWADRLLGNAERELKTKGSTKHVVEIFPLINELTAKSASPLAAYMFGRQMYGLSTTHNPAYVVGALQVGYARGDSSAKDALAAFELKHPGVDEALVRQVIHALEAPRQKGP